MEMECITDGLAIHTDGVASLREEEVKLCFEVTSFPKLVLSEEKLDGVRCGYKSEVLALHTSVSYSASSQLTQEEQKNWAFKSKLEFCREALKNIEEARNYYKNKLDATEVELRSWQKEDRRGCRRSMRLQLKKRLSPYI